MYARLCAVSLCARRFSVVTPFLSRHRPCVRLKSSQNNAFSPMILEQQQQHTKIVSAESQISIADLLLSIINIDLLLAALADGRFFFFLHFIILVCVVQRF